MNTETKNIEITNKRVKRRRRNLKRNRYYNGYTENKGIKIEKCNNPEDHIKKMLLKRRSKVLLPVNIKSITEKLCNNLREKICIIEFPTEGTSVESVDFDNENIVTFNVKINNEKFYRLNYHNGKLIENLKNDNDNENNKIKSDQEEVLNTESIDIIKSTINKLYQEEYKNIEQLSHLSIAFNQNLESLGYCMDEELFMKTATLNEEEFDKVGKEVIDTLKEIIGANVMYNPVNPNFPTITINQLYYSNYFRSVDYHWEMTGSKPSKNSDEIKEKDVKDKYMNLKYISAGSESDVHEMMSNLMNSAEALSPNDISDLTKYFQKYPDRMRSIPESFVNKENLASIIYIILCLCKDREKLLYSCEDDEKILKHFKKNEEILSVTEISKRFKTVTDVLRLATVLSGYSAAMDQVAIRYKSFSNKERRLIMYLLNNCNNRIDDFNLHKNKWERICERIHPGKFKKTYPNLVQDLLGVYEFQKPLKMAKREIKYYEKIKKNVNDNNTTLEVKIKDSCNSENNSNKSLKSNKEIRAIGKYNKYCDIRKYRRYRGFKNDNHVCYGDISNGEPTFFINSGRVFKNNSLSNKIINYINERLILLDELKVLKQIPDSIRNHLENILSTYNYVIPNTYELNKNKIILNKNEIDTRSRYLSTLYDELMQSVKSYKIKHQTFASKVEYKLKNKEYVEAMEMLSQKPGIFARKLDELLKICDDQNTVLEMFEDIATKVSIKVLLSMKGYFKRRNQDLNERIFVIRGKITKFYMLKEFKKALEKSTCEKICRICECALIEKFENKKKLNNVYINKKWKNQIIPQDLRNINSSSENYSKGSRFSISSKILTTNERNEMVSRLKEEEEDNESKKTILMNEKLELEKSNVKMFCGKFEHGEKCNCVYNQILNRINVLSSQINTINEENKIISNEIQILNGSKLNYKKVRCFIWNNKYASSYISLLIFDDKYQKLSISSNKDYQIYYSREYKHDDNNEEIAISKFVDLNPEAIKSKGGRYVLLNIVTSNNYYYSINNPIAKCIFGCMEIEDIRHVNKKFDPKEVKVKFDLTLGNVIPIIFDCETKEYIYVNTEITERYWNYWRYWNYNTKFLVLAHIVKYYCNEPMKENMYNLIDMHVKARNGTLVESKEELKNGDTAFVMTLPYKKIEGVNYIRPTDLDIIMSEYMT